MLLADILSYLENKVGSEIIIYRMEVFKDEEV